MPSKNISERWPTSQATSGLFIWPICMGESAGQTKIENSNPARRIRSVAQFDDAAAFAVSSMPREIKDVFFVGERSLCGND